MSETQIQTGLAETQTVTPPIAHAGELAVGLQARNDWLDSKLNADPTRLLPTIDLKPVDKERLVVAFDDGTVMPERTPTPDIPTSHYDVNDAEGQRIGFVVMKEPAAIEGQQQKHYIGDIKIIDSMRGQGYGPATYLAILKNLPLGVGLKTEGVMQDGAIKSWERLEAAGLAERIGGEDTSPVAYQTTF